MSLVTSAYEMVVGLEVHAELKTQSKIFCSCPTDFGAPPNTQCCPVCMGLPGALPVLNGAAVDFAVKAGLATNCTIANVSKLDRKNYFYPDMPKAYQISQYDLPLCRNGFLEIETEQGSKKIGIVRIHIEEDAGKLIHDENGETLLDFNRCGIGLIEIVSAPDVRSGEEARAYLQKLRTVLLYTGVSDCRMNEGSLRCDVNLSVRKKGDPSFGVRTEIKNLNSFSYIVKAIDYEFRRQVALLEAGETVCQQTRRFDVSTGKTELMRIKENADDYRYFPEPDLPPIHIDEKRIEALRGELPRLPDERKRDYLERYGLSVYDAEVLCADPLLAEYFECGAEQTEYPKLLANMMLSELMRLSASERFSCPISPSHMAKLADLLGGEIINSSTAKALIAQMWEKDRSPEELVREQGLMQINDTALLRTEIEEALRANPKALSDYRNGKKAAAKVIVGRVMASTRGRANPVLLGRLVEERMNEA